MDGELVLNTGVIVDVVGFEVGALFRSLQSFDLCVLFLGSDLVDIGHTKIYDLDQLDLSDLLP